MEIWALTERILNIACVTSSQALFKKHNKANLVTMWPIFYFRFTTLDFSSEFYTSPAHNHLLHPALVQQHPPTGAVRHISAVKESKKGFGCAKFKKQWKITQQCEWTREKKQSSPFPSNVPNISEHRAPSCNLDCTFCIWYRYQIHSCQQTP